MPKDFILYALFGGHFCLCGINPFEFKGVEIRIVRTLMIYVEPPLLKGLRGNTCRLPRQHVQTPEVTRATSRVTSRYSGRKLFFSERKLFFSERK